MKPERNSLFMALLLTFCGGMASAPADELECASYLLPPSQAQYTHWATNSGNWNNSDTWNNGQIPGAAALVLIPSNIVVTVNRVFTNYPLTMVVVDGTLAFRTTGNSELLLGTMLITDSGVLTMGTAAHPIPSNYFARITITATNPCIYSGFTDTNALSRGIISDGNIQMYGAAKTSYLPLSGQGAPVGATNLVMAAVPSGWQVGDQIVVPATTFYRSFKLADMTTNGYLQNEVRTISTINGATITLDRALVYDHSCAGVAGGQIHIANLTRNVVVRSQQFIDQSYDDTNNIAGRGHVMTCTNNASFFNAAFIGLGRTDKRSYNTDPFAGPNGPGSTNNVRGRYALHFHECGDEDLTQVAGVVSGCVVNDTPGWGFVNHSSYVHMTNNVAYNFGGAGFVCQDGDEAGEIMGCLAIGGTGLGRFPYGRTVFGDGPRMSHSDMGFHGDGFWFQGPDVSCINNIAAACKGSGFMFWAVGRYDESTGHMTAFPTNRTTVKCRHYENSGPANGQYVISQVPLRQVSGNVAYACMTGLKFRFQNNVGASAINGFPGKLYAEVFGSNTFASETLTDTLIWNCLNGLHSGYQSKLNVNNLTVTWVDTNSPQGGVAVAANKQVGGMTYTNVYITNMLTGFYTDGTDKESNINMGNVTQSNTTSTVLGYSQLNQRFADLPSLPNEIAGPSGSGITAVANGPIDSTNTWGVPLPVAGDTNVWQTGGANLSLSVKNTTFYGDTFAIQDGGQFNPGIATATLTCRNLLLDGGTILIGNNNGLTVNLSGDTLTLNSGTLQAGGANNSRDLRFQNGALAGSGLVDVTATGAAGSSVVFQSTVSTTNFTGTFSVHDNGILDLPAVSTNNASFTLDLEDNGQYLNNANVALVALITNGVSVNPGVYPSGTFPTNMVLNNGGTITVLAQGQFAPGARSLVVANSAPALHVMANQMLIAGQTLAFTNVASDTDVPAQSLSFSLLNAPAGATVTTNTGVFTWRPAIAQSPSTNAISVVVTDNGSPSLSATQSFVVTVTRPMNPVVSAAAMRNGLLSFDVAGDSGPDYVVQASTNLTDWTSIWTNAAPTSPFQFTDPAATNFNQRYYRVLLGL